jgi:hypothetical protein
MGRTGISWTFWSWNPNTGDTSGVLKDDWTTAHADKMSLLSALMDPRPFDFGSTITPVDPEPEPEPEREPMGPAQVTSFALDLAADSRIPGLRT